MFHLADVSATTNYNWNSVTEDEQKDEVTVEIGISIGAKTNLRIKQAVGTCGGSTAKTQMVQVNEVRSDTGELIRSYFHSDGVKRDAQGNELPDLL